MLVIKTFKSLKMKETLTKYNFYLNLFSTLNIFIIKIFLSDKCFNPLSQIKVEKNVSNVMIERVLNINNQK